MKQLTDFGEESRYVSPRKRAQRTLELLDLGCREKLPWQDSHTPSLSPKTNAKVQITEDIREWDYGDYEGKTSKQIREERREKGIGGDNGEWDIWREGCPGGEYVPSPSSLGVAFCDTVAGRLIKRML